MALACRAGVRSVGIDLPQIDGITQHPPQARPAPVPPPMGGERPLLLQRGDDGAQRRPILQVAGEDLLDHRAFCRIHLHAGRIAGAVGIDAVAIGHAGPGQERPGAQFRQPSPPHPLGNEGALVFGDGSTDLQQQLVVGVVTHGTVKELHEAAEALQFFEQEHLVHILARQAVWGGDEDVLHLRRGNCIAQRIQARAA